MGTAKRGLRDGITILAVLFSKTIFNKVKAIYEVLLRSLKIGYVETYAALNPDTVFQSLTSMSALMSLIFLAPVSVIATRISLAIRSSILATPFSPSVPKA